MAITGQFNLPMGFEFAAVFLFAVTGGLLAIEQRYDVIGVFMLALLSAVGGGLVRDVFFLPQGPPLLLEDDRYLYVVVVATAFCLIFGAHLNRFHVVFLLVDALGLGTYAVVGTQRALDFGLNVFPAAFVGLANAVGGGVLRDVLTRKETLILQPGQFYALAAATGTVVFVILAVWMRLPATEAAIWSIATTFVIRLAAVAFNWTTRAARPLLGPRDWN